MGSRNQVESRTVKISECKPILRRAVAKRRPVFVWGPPGVGKSDMVNQIASEFPNSAVIDLRMALMDPTDIKGVPYYAADQNTMKWAPPSELPNKEFAEQYDIVFLFLDELNSAPPAVQAAAYQLVLNRKVGQYGLPDNVVIIAAGNRMGDKGVTYRMPSPLANRFMHLEIRVDFEDWEHWALGHEIHPHVVGFLKQFKGDLYNFDPVQHDRAFATPRTWSFVSDMLDDNLPDSANTDMVAGLVGEGMAIKFMAHRKHAADLPDPADVLSGKVKEFKAKEVSATYALVTSLCYELRTRYEDAKRSGKGEGFNESADNWLGFMMANFEPEMVIMGAHTVLKNYKVVFDRKKMKNFPEFFKRYANLLTDE
jgi:hypothetical protein